tara:strand:- start:3975 stop:4334 length:360 start_codon:yes stop_codon:yes gene_type:complete
MMDERLSKALEFSNYMITLNNQKRVLKEKYYESAIHYFNGGQFSVAKELITFVNMLCTKGNDSDIVLLDDNDTPVRIEDLNTFFTDILDIYFTATNEYQTEYEKIRTKRSVNGLVEYEQ